MNRYAIYNVSGVYLFDIKATDRDEAIHAAQVIDGSAVSAVEVAHDNTDVSRR